MSNQSNYQSTSNSLHVKDAQDCVLDGKKLKIISIANEEPWTKFR